MATTEASGERTRPVLVLVLALVLLGTGCTAQARSQGLRLGYFAALTHAPALVGLESGAFAEELPRLRTQLFSAGPAAIEALSAGAVDAAYIGAAPITNSWVRSEGRSALVVAGSTFGGAGLVATPEAATRLKAGVGLATVRYATPGLGNTQDVALRSWLSTHGIRPSLTGQGQAAVSPMRNGQILTLFTTGAIDAAWVAEPWRTRLVLEAGAEPVLDESALWPSGQHPTAVLAVDADYLEDHPESVRALLRAHLRSIAAIYADPDRAAQLANTRLGEDAGTALAPEVLDRAWAELDFSAEIDSAALEAYHEMAVRTGVQPAGSVTGLCDPGPLETVRAKTGKE